MPAGTSPPAPLGHQRFPIGQAVYVLRSDGSETIGFVEHYSVTTGLYDIMLERPDSNVRKKATEENIRVAPPAAAAKAGALPQKFAIGLQVLVKRSSGDESVAYVKEYNPIKGVYKLELDCVGSGQMKHAKGDTIRAAQGNAPMQGGAAQDDIMALI